MLMQIAVEALDMERRNISIWGDYKGASQMQITAIRFYFLNHKSWTWSVFGASVLTSVFAAIALTGCSHRHTASIGEGFVPRSETHQSSTKAWVPIREEHHSIVAVGDYRLPEAIVIPPALTPMPLALANVTKSSNQIISIQVYFPPAQEQAVYQWAQSYPCAISSSGGFHWQRKGKHFGKRDPRNISVGSVAGAIELRHQPQKAPYSWSFDGYANTKDFGYGIVWGGEWGLSAQMLKRIELNKQQVMPTEYANNSPIKGEPRRIFMGLNWHRGLDPKSETKS